MEQRIENIRKIAKIYLWKEILHNEEQFLLRFSSENNLIDVWYSKMTVGSIIDHPTKGRNQLFRRNVYEIKELEKIFANPRHHTQKGYYGGGDRITRKLIKKCPHCGKDI